MLENQILKMVKSEHSHIYYPYSSIFSLINYLTLQLKHKETTI